MTDAADALPARSDVPLMSDGDFAALARIVHARTGIVLTDNKRWMLTSRLTKELRRLGLSRFADYRTLLERAPEGEEVQALVSAVTTNVTSFFREPAQFTALAGLIPDFRRRAQAGDRIRLWSAGCSSGQEPYSIAMTLLEHWPEAGSADLRILATDIDAAVVGQARTGVYDARGIDLAGAPLLRRFAQPGPAPDTLAMAPALRALIRFETLNLHGPWPFSGRFDVIFCRNVVIYFDADTRRTLWSRFAERLVPGGWLYVGHSERVDPMLEPLLRPAGVTRYQRTDRPVSAPSAQPAPGVTGPGLGGAGHGGPGIPASEVAAPKVAAPGVAGPGVAGLGVGGLGVAGPGLGEPQMPTTPRRGAAVPPGPVQRSALPTRPGAARASAQQGNSGWP